MSLNGTVNDLYTKPYPNLSQMPIRAQTAFDNLGDLQYFHNGMKLGIFKLAKKKKYFILTATISNPE